MHRFNLRKHKSPSTYAVCVCVMRASTKFAFYLCTDKLAAGNNVRGNNVDLCANKTGAREWKKKRKKNEGKVHVKRTSVRTKTRERLFAPRSSVYVSNNLHRGNNIYYVYIAFKISLLHSSCCILYRGVRFRRIILPHSALINVNKIAISNFVAR